MANRKIATGTPKTLRQSAYDSVVTAVIFGDLAPGSIVEERRLAREMNLGLASVRDALYRLSLEGLIERHARIGTRVPDLGLREMQDVFEARVLVEGSCAALAAERATPDRIDAMRNAFVGYEDAIAERDFRSLVLMDIAFHRAIAAATANRQIERQVTMLHNNASRFWYFGLSRLDPNEIRDDIREHMLVTEAIAARDPVAAKKAMRAVLGRFPEYFRSFLFIPATVEESEYVD